MSRVRKGVASEEKGATSQEGSRTDSKLEFMVKFVAMIEEKLSGFDKRLKEMNGCLERIEKTRSAVQAGVLEDTSTQRHGASKDGVTQKYPANRNWYLI